MATGSTDTALLKDRVIEAYGGRDRWDQATAVEATISMGGLLLRMKGQGKGLAGLHATTRLGEPHVRIEPIDEDGNVGVLDGHSVRIETPAGEVVRSRSDARERLPRLLGWDRLEALHFIAYTQWTYNNLPPLLWRDGMEWRPLSDDALEARFPADVPTHSERQVFHFDRETGLLRQLDYTADVFGSWARAAHVVEEHGVSDGIPYPSKRRVWSRRRDGSPRTSPAPLMVMLDVHEWRLV